LDLGDRGAVLERVRDGEHLGAALDGIGHAPQRVGTLGGRTGRPRGEGRAGGSHRGIDIGRGAFGDRAPGLTRRRIDDGLVR